MNTYININKVKEMDIEKTLCKQCETCKDFTYQRTITRGPRKGELWKFQYCQGNADIIKHGNWGPDVTKLKGGDKEYVCRTKVINGKKDHFTSYLKNNPRNVISHLGDTLDCRMRMLREISKRCSSQTQKSKESKFPGVGLISLYKKNPKKFKDKKIWYARININGEMKYLDNYYTELEAAHAYYTECQRLDLDINKETLEWKIYQRWLGVKKFTEKIIEKINEDYEKRERVDKNWYLELLKSELK